MLDLFAIFTAGGIILWVHTTPFSKNDYRSIINAYIRASSLMVIEEKMVLGSLELRWTQHRDLGLHFLVLFVLSSNHARLHTKGFCH